MPPSCGGSRLTLKNGEYYNTINYQHKTFKRIEKDKAFTYRWITTLTIEQNHPLSSDTKTRIGFQIKYHRLNHLLLLFEIQTTLQVLSLTDKCRLSRQMSGTLNRQNNMTHITMTKLPALYRCGDNRTAHRGKKNTKSTHRLSFCQKNSFCKEHFIC